MNIEYKQLQELLADKLSVDAKEVVPNANLVTNLGADSLDLVDVVMECEERYGIEIPDSEAEKLYTVQDVFDYIKQYS